MVVTDRRDSFIENARRVDPDEHNFVAQARGWNASGESITDRETREVRRMSEVEQDLHIDRVGVDVRSIIRRERMHDAAAKWERNRVGRERAELHSVLCQVNRGDAKRKRVQPLAALRLFEKPGPAHFWGRLLDLFIHRKIIIKSKS